MQYIQPKRSKYKKCTKNYVQDNILDIIDIEETLLKNRFITKVQKSDFLYSNFLPKNESLKPFSPSKPILFKSFSKEKLLPIKDQKYSTFNNINTNLANKDNKNILTLNPDNINYELLNRNKFEINFKKLKLEYKNGYKVHFIKEYYPVEIIGAGAFGLVVHVIQIKTGQKMAVKIINKNNVNYNADAEYLHNEVNILKRLDNPRIMKIYDILDNHHYFLIFMELIEGGNLKDLIIKRYLDNNIYLFRDSECATIMKGILEALNYLHKKNIIHRDIKPENILFKNKDDLSSVIICDFGLAYQLNEYENNISGRCGTTIYMAPEILLKKNYDYLVDSFSAGIVLYILCSGGMHPFYKKGTSRREYTEKFLQQKCLCKFSTEMPLLARNLFLKLCKYEPIFRYEAYKALNHPWITRSTKSQIPMTILEEYNKHDKIKTFQALLSSVISLSILKKHLGITKKLEEFSKNNSFCENSDKKPNRRRNTTIGKIINNNKFMIFTSVKKSEKIILEDINTKKDKIINEEKINISKKLGIIKAKLFNLGSTKNQYKIKEPLMLSKPNFFVTTGKHFNKGKFYNNNNENYPELGNNLKTNSSKENYQIKENRKNSITKTYFKYNQTKSFS